MEQKNFSCDDVQAVLSGLLDGELPADVVHCVEVHLVGCECCRARANEAEELDAEVRGAVEAGEGDWSMSLERRILFAINDPSAELRILRRLRLSAWSGWGTAVAALLMLTFSLMYSGAGDAGDAGGNLVASGNSRAGTDGNGFVEDVQAGDSDEVRMAVLGEVEADQAGESMLTNAIATTAEGSELVEDGEVDDEVIENILNDDASFEGLETKIARDDAMIDVGADLAAVSDRLSAFEVPRSRSTDSVSLTGAVDDEEIDRGLAVAAAPLDFEANLIARARGSDGDVDGDVDGVGAVVGEIVPTLIASDWEIGLDDVFYDAAILLHAIEDAEVDSFSDLREINRVLEYDELLERLASSRDELWGEDALLVERAWAVLERVSGPIDQGRLLRVQELLAVDDLAGRLKTMSDQYGTY